MLTTRCYSSLPFVNIQNKIVMILPFQIHTRFSSSCNLLVQIISIIMCHPIIKTGSLYTKHVRFPFLGKRHIMNMYSHNPIMPVAVYRSSRECLRRHPLHAVM